jgi:hypothetical protein
MQIVEFLGLNVVIVGVLVGAVFLYLIFLINKRRKEKFLHHEMGKHTPH